MIKMLKITLLYKNINVRASGYMNPGSVLKMYSHMIIEATVDGQVTISEMQPPRK